MSSYNYTNTYIYIEEQQSATVTGTPFPLGGSPAFSFQFVFSGIDVIGSIQLQESIDGSTFSDFSSPVAVTASQSKLISESTNAKYIRAVWTHTSGTGNITAYLYSVPLIIGNLV